MKKAKAGFTLAELCLAIAITTVVFAMAASFTAIVYFRAQAAVGREETTEQLDALRDGIYSYLREFDKSKYTLKTDDLYGSGLAVYDGDDKITYISFDENLLKINGNKASEPYSHIDAATFKLITATGTEEAKALVICDVTYRVNSSSEESTVNFAFYLNAAQGTETLGDIDGGR